MRALGVRMVSMWRYYTTHSTMWVVIHETDCLGDGEVFLLLGCERFEGPIDGSTASPLFVTGDGSGVLILQNDETKIVFRKMKSCGGFYEFLRSDRESTSNE